MSGTHARRRTAREIDSERLASLLEQTVLISLATASFVRHWRHRHCTAVARLTESAAELTIGRYTVHVAVHCRS